MEKAAEKRLPRQACSRWDVYRGDTVSAMGSERETGSDQMFSRGTAGCAATFVWGDGYLGYDFGEHPMTPVRLDLTVSLARELGVLDHLTVIEPHPADRAQLLEVHSPDYLDAIRAASADPGYVGFGLGSADNPVFKGMFEAASLIAGGSRMAALDVWSGRSQHAVNIAGGLHHAMRDSAAGFCVINDVVVAIRALLDAGAQRIAYVDIDVHHGDGVQAALLRRSAGADPVGAPGPANALSRHRHGDRDRHRRG